jgi:hypothetical protein
MPGLRVGIGVHGNGFHAQALGSRSHSASDLTSVCNEDLVEHF